MADPLEIFESPKALTQIEIRGTSNAGAGAAATIGHFTINAPGPNFLPILMETFRGSQVFEINVNSPKDFWVNLAPLLNPVMLLCFGSGNNPTLANCDAKFLFFSGYNTVSLPAGAAGALNLFQTFQVDAHHWGPIPMSGNWKNFRVYNYELLTGVPSDVQMNYTFIPPRMGATGVQIQNTLAWLTFRGN